jgi:hypothetical protein
MTEKSKPLSVAVTTENGTNTNEPNGSDMPLSTRNYTPESGLLQFESLIIDATYTPEPYADWHWGWFAGEVSEDDDIRDVAEGHGICLLCDCSKCIGEAIKVSHYYSLIEALRWLAGNAPNTGTIIVVGSSQIIEEVRNRATCDSLMSSELHRTSVELLCKVNADLVFFDQESKTGEEIYV